MLRSYITYKFFFLSGSFVCDIFLSVSFSIVRWGILISIRKKHNLFILELLTVTTRKKTLSRFIQSGSRSHDRLETSRRTYIHLNFHYNIHQFYYNWLNSYRNYSKRCQCINKVYICPNSRLKKLDCSHFKVDYIVRLDPALEFSLIHRWTILMYRSIAFQKARLALICVDRKLRRVRLKFW